MELTVTNNANKALKQVGNDKMVQLSFDKGSCDIVNTIYEILVIPRRTVSPIEKTITVNNIDFLFDESFEEAYDHQLVIDYVGGFFVFKNKNQIFNNRVGIKFV
ncbi:iron-sulfur cluster biosynthesis family protein [Neobacillus sp. KR4-4]|uniref:iron-sulfur cluster biosynthesis family protein n=1 Tax=Neobacillus sp. KR4-4 TaxID=3344872 RepID=UPI0035CBC4C1